MRKLIAMGGSTRSKPITPDLMPELIFAGDRDIDGADLLARQRTNGSTTDLNANNDCVVSQAELALWKRTFGAQGLSPANATASQSPVPESSSALLMFAAGVVSALRRSLET